MDINTWLKYYYDKLSLLSTLSPPRRMKESFYKVVVTVSLQRKSNGESIQINPFQQ